jgi:aldehyde:ferredoxin oxidoreductase
VMGAKKLGAIGVYGSQKVPLAEEAKFHELAHQWREANMGQVATQDLSKFGTARTLGLVYDMGDLPIKNWSRGSLRGWESLTGEYIVKNMLKKHTTCPSCAVAHTKVLDLNGGP